MITRKRILRTTQALALTFFALFIVAEPVTAQDDGGGAAPIEDSAEKVKGKQSLFDLIKAGGWAMWILGAFSLGLVGLFVYSLIDLTKGNFVPADLVLSVNSDMEAADIEGGLAKVQPGDNCFSVVVKKGLEHVKDNGYESIQSDDIRVEMAKVSNRFTRSRALQVNLFSIIAQAAPMVGLLGTVSGMIKAFGQLSSGENNKPDAFAESISEALVTTASGLVVALPAIFCYFILKYKLQSLVTDANDQASDMLAKLRRSVSAYNQ